MVFITGDKHAQLEPFIENSNYKKLKKGDTLIICGDFGFLWDKSDEEYKKLRWLSKRKYNIAFIEGCYDNMKIIEEYPVSMWNGGRVRLISSNIIYLMQGEVYTIDGRKFLVFGGGFDVNVSLNTEMKNNWWPERSKNKQNVDNVIKNIGKNNADVDVIVSYEAPASLKYCFEEVIEINAINYILEEIRLHCRFKNWFFGKYHIDKKIAPRYCAVFEKLIKIT